MVAAEVAEGVEFVTALVCLTVGPALVAGPVEVEGVAERVTRADGGALVGVGVGVA